VEILQGGTTRYQYCIKCTVPINEVNGGQSDTAPAQEPTSTIGYPIPASVDYCEDMRTVGIQAVESRMDAISTSGSGACCTREEQ
jgi:hypothetical protein